MLPLDEIRTFVDEEIIPLERHLLAQEFDTLESRIKELREEVKKRGWWAPHVETKHGGAGLSLVEFGRLSEVLGRTPMGHLCFNCQAPDAGNIEILIEHATDAQKERFLDPLVRGEIRSCFGMTEPENAGSDPTMLSTVALKDGDDYVINGHKWFTSSADGASFCIVMAVTDPESDNVYGRASMILVPTDTPGYEFVRNIPVMGEAGHGYASHAEIRFNDCRVPQSNLLGYENAGFMIAQQRLGPGRIHHCMRWIGIAERGLDLMCRRAVSRQIGDRALGKRQTLRTWVAESRAEIDAARLLVLDTAAKIEEHGQHAVRVQVSAIKFYVANIMHKVLDRAIQAHGALGVTDDTVLAYLWRHERAARIYDGPDEVHKMVVARRILREYEGGSK